VCPGDLNEEKEETAVCGETRHDESIRSSGVVFSREDVTPVGFLAIVGSDGDALCADSQFLGEA
jgi:hypothetical protein